MTKICFKPLCTDPVHASDSSFSTESNSFNLITSVSKIFLRIQVFIVNLSKDLLYGPGFTRDKICYIEALGSCIKKTHADAKSHKLAIQLLNESTYSPQIFNYRTIRAIQIPKVFKKTKCSCLDNYQAGLEFLANYTHKLAVVQKIDNRQELFSKVTATINSEFKPDEANKLRYRELHQIYSVHKLGDLQSIINAKINIHEEKTQVLKQEEIDLSDKIVSELWKKHNLDNAYFVCFREDSSSLFKRSKLSYTHGLRSFIRRGTQQHTSLVHLKSPEKRPSNSHITFSKYENNPMSFSEYICSEFFSLNPEKFVEDQQRSLLKKLWLVETDKEVHERIRRVFEVEFKEMHESDHGFQGLKNSTWRRVQTLLGFKKSWKKQDPKDIDFSKSQYMGCSEFQAKMIVKWFYQINQQLVLQCKEKGLLPRSENYTLFKAPFGSHLKLNKIVPATLAKKYLPKIANRVHPSEVLKNIIKTGEVLFLK